MRFKVFGYHERFYQWIAYISVVLITIGGVGYYLVLKENSVAGTKDAKGFLIEFQDSSFIIGVAYALFLFIIGLYLSSMSSKVQNLYYRRKEQYINLKRLSNMVLDKRLDNVSDDKVKSKIIFHRGVTGRLEEKERRPYIIEDGYKYTPKYLKLEDDLLLIGSKLTKFFDVKINKYIDCYSLKKRHPYVFIHDLDDFLLNTENWIDKHLDVAEAQRTALVDYIRKLVNANSDIKKHNRNKRKFKRVYIKNDRKVRNITSRIEKIYGARLHNDIKFEDNLTISLNALEDLIIGLENKTLTDEDLLEMLGDQSSELLGEINIIHARLHELQEIIEDIRGL
ncbi:hypothetical protein DMN77_07610 [Paenibacillus sp. 79R4]|uniref:hypothetical protein n=1 Tax=Paenibacillus sp. 79R4 TaxID=2212847 RepID=UPI0015BA525C|nr:hypothetical protein [Paenibacillus sp. 79R4]NWL87468.1 hypothetical protein [Paenibacillus sp. 79R4]